MSLAEIRNIFHLFPCCCMYYQSNTLNILTQQKLRELTESVSMSLGYVDAALLNVWQHVCVLSWILSCFHYCPLFEQLEFSVLLEKLRRAQEKQRCLFLLSKKTKRHAWRNLLIAVRVFLNGCRLLCAAVHSIRIFLERKHASWPSLCYKEYLQPSLWATANGSSLHASMRIVYSVSRYAIALLFNVRP